MERVAYGNGPVSAERGGEPKQTAEGEAVQFIAMQMVNADLGIHLGPDHMRGL
jgi:hypothetical protein